MRESEFKGVKIPKKCFLGKFFGYNSPKNLLENVKTAKNVHAVCATTVQRPWRSYKGECKDCKMCMRFAQPRCICDGKSLVLPKTCNPSCLEKMLYGEIYSDSERRASNLLAFSSQPIRNQPGGALAGF